MGVMSFLYFAYGSNLWEPRMRSRCPSAKPVGTGVLNGWRLVCDKPSVDGSAKFNIRPDGSGVVHGALYEISDGERDALDSAEPRYIAVAIDVGGRRAMTYRYRGDTSSDPPHDWYVDLALDGAREHGLPNDTIMTAAGQE